MGPFLGHLRGPDHETEFGFGFSDLENPIGRDENVIFTEIDFSPKMLEFLQPLELLALLGHILR